MSEQTNFDEKMLGIVELLKKGCGKLKEMSHTPYLGYCFSVSDESNTHCSDFMLSVGVISSTVYLTDNNSFVRIPCSQEVCDILFEQIQKMRHEGKSDYLNEALGKILGEGDD